MFNSSQVHHLHEGCTYGRSIEGILFLPNKKPHMVATGVLIFILIDNNEYVYLLPRNVEARKGFQKAHDTSSIQDPIL